MVYDGLGRVTKQYTAYDTDETAYTDADDVTGDTVLEQSVVDLRCQRQRDPDHQLPAQTHRSRHGRTHDLVGPRDVRGQLVRWGQSHDRHGQLRHQRRRGLLTALHRSGAERHGAGHHAPSTTRPARPTRRSIRRARRAAASSTMRAAPPRQIGNYVDGNPATGAQRRGCDGGNGLQLGRPGHHAHGQEPDHGRPGHEVRVRHAPPAASRPKCIATICCGPRSIRTVTTPRHWAMGPTARTTGSNTRIIIQGERLDRKDQNGTVHTYDLDKLGRVTHDRVTTLGHGRGRHRASREHDVRDSGPA